MKLKQDNCQENQLGKIIVKPLKKIRKEKHLKQPKEEKRHINFKGATVRWINDNVSLKIMK